MSFITISDPTLRDGNHSVNHQISLKMVAEYCRFAESAKIRIVEVGHGNGLGASSLLIGQMPHTDRQLLYTARENLIDSQLGVHVIPGIATIDRDISPAIDIGVDVFRVGCHVTEANITQPHIEFIRNSGKTAVGVLMMTALVDIKTLVSEAQKMEKYGVSDIIIMDSTGTYLPSDVSERIKALRNGLVVGVGFHAHNNLGMAVANSLAAAESGATIIDATMRGFGAGAGNTQLEVLIPVLEKSGFLTYVDFKRVIKEANTVMEYMIVKPPTVSPINILTGLNKLFSGFEKPIMKAASLYKVEYSELVRLLGERKLVAGQEDLIMEVAQNLSLRNK